MRTEGNALKNGESTAGFSFMTMLQAHQSVLVEDFLSKNATTLRHHPYSPDMAAADFYLFPQMKSALKKQCFCDGNDIIKKVTDEP